MRCKSVADNLGSMEITCTDVQVDSQMVIMKAMRTMILKSDMVVVSQRVGRARCCDGMWGRLGSNATLVLEQWVTPLSFFRSPQSSWLRCAH